MQFEMTQPGGVSGDLVSDESSEEFKLDFVADVLFMVEGLSAGTVTIETRASKDIGEWVALDPVELVFSADGCKVARWGSSEVRATTAAAATSGTLRVWISGANVSRTA